MYNNTDEPSLQSVAKQVLTINTLMEIPLFNLATNTFKMLYFTL